jgi:hypothetical protein
MLSSICFEVISVIVCFPIRKSSTLFINIVTSRPIARERVDKHVSMEMDSWKPTRYEHISVDTSDQKTFPWIQILYIRGEQN